MNDVETLAMVQEDSHILTLDVVGGLPFPRLWNYEILAYGCQENRVLTGELSEFEMCCIIFLPLTDKMLQDNVVLNKIIGTHDFYNIEVSSPRSGDVMVTGTFADGSTATGVLLIVVNESSIYHYQAERYGDSVRDNIISGVPGGYYMLVLLIQTYFRC